MTESPERLRTVRGVSELAAELLTERGLDGLLRHLSARVDSLRPRLDDCRRVWAILTRSAESTHLRGETRKFCERMTAEVERRIREETPEALVARCESQEFGLPQAKTVCTKHPVTTYLERVEDLRRRLPELEARAMEFDKARRKLADLPRRRTQEYRRKLRVAAFRAIAPWGFVAASKGGELIRHFAPLLRSDHRDCRGLNSWSLPWLHGAALISALATICLGLAVPRVLTGAGPIWGTMLALTALGYLLGTILWTTQTVWVFRLEVEKAQAEKRKARSQRLEARWKRARSPEQGGDRERRS